MVTKTPKANYSANKIRIDEKRGNAIDQYIRNNKELAARVYSAAQVDIEVRGKPDVAHVFRLPRKLLTLNPENHRFATDWANLKIDRVTQGKKAEFDLDDDDDIQEIRDVLTGVNPPNEPRAQTFKALKDAMERLAGRSKFNDHNGQRDPGIITWDGRYINSNRRDTALEQIQDQLRKKGKKTGIDVTKFDFIYVGRCPRVITQDDIMSMEMAEQISKSVRDSYDYMNAGILIRRKYDTALKSKISSSDSATRRKKKEDTAVQEVADKMENVGVKQVQEYLNFMQFSDGVLAMMRTPEQYHLVNKSSGAKVPISYLLREAAKDWNKLPTARDKKNFMEEIAMECVMHQNEKTKDDFPVRSNYRDFRHAVTNKASKWQIRTAASKFNFNNQDKAVQDALPVVQKALDKYGAEKESKEPVKLLSKTLESITAIDRAITTSSGAAQKLKKLAERPDVVSDVITVAEKIKATINKFNRQKKSSGAQKSKPKVKKKTKKKKGKKGKKRVSPGRHSKR